MSDSKSVNNDILKKDSSKEVKFPDIEDESKIQEALNTFCKDISKINLLDECGWTPLYRTIIAGDLKATNILIKKGANPNIQCSMGETPLFQAVDMCKLDHVKLLIKNGANPNLTQDDGLSPLHAAVTRQNLLIVKYLLKNGANPNIKSKIYDQTPVHLAIKNNVDPMIMLLLVQFNGSLLDIDKFGKKPIDYICSKEMKDAIEKLKFEKKPDKKLVLLPLFQTPKKYKNWSISKVYSNTIRSNSPKNELNFNYNTTLKDPGNVKFNFVGTNDKHSKKNISQINEDNNNKKGKAHNSNSCKELVNNNIKDISKLNIEKENYDPNINKKRLSFSECRLTIKEESSCIESDRGDDSVHEKINIKKSVRNKHKKYLTSNNLKINSNFENKKTKSDKDNLSSKIPKNKSYNTNYTFYIIPNQSNNNDNSNTEIKNFKFVQIYGNSKAKKGSFSINPENQRRILNQSLNMSDFKESLSERSIRSNNFLYTKPILSLNELNAKKLSFSHCNNNISFGNNNDFIKKKSFDNTNNKNISTNKKSSKEIKRLFTFMDSENTNKNSAVDNTPLLQCSKNSLNTSRNRNSLIILENNNSNSNFDCQRKAFSISGNNTKRNNSTLNDDSINYNNTNLWKFKTIEEDNIFHNKKTSGNTTVTTYSYNIDITNQNALYPIYEWLKEINLVCYYNLFIDKKIYNLDKTIYNLKNGLCNISKNDIMELGINIPGHIYRIITKMEIDSEKINNQISNFLFGKMNLMYGGEINVLKNSVYYCCGCCSVNNQSKYYCNDDIFKKYQLEKWLSRIRMNKYEGNFIENGFDMFEYFILQMFSSIPIDENILKEELKIHNINDRDFILLQINKDVKFIIQKVRRFNNHVINEEISIKKNAENNKKDDESPICIIF